MVKIWPEADTELLIEKLKKCEVIWNPKHSKYTDNKRVCHHFWIKFTKLFNESHGTNVYKLHDIISKWCRLSYKFDKESKKISDLKTVSSSWRHYFSLSFLIPYPIRRRKKREIIRKKYSLRKVGNREVSDEDTEVSVGSISPKNIKHADGDKYNSITHISSNDSCTKTDEEAGYVSIGSVSPPCAGQDFCLTTAPKESAMTLEGL